jgi:hypothetical protein
VVQVLRANEQVVPHLKNREQIKGMFSKGDILLTSSKVTKRDWIIGSFHPSLVWDDFYQENRILFGKRILIQLSLFNTEISNKINE